MELMKNYLGDGCYARLDDDRSTENGVETTNEIHLEPEVVEAFLTFIMKARGEVNRRAKKNST